ncbi:siderophore-interacting protein [Gordonia hydrophobica]|uniref:Siderophore-interacting protein n=1 Tax=Gordonia hydrophobica TaxID=40516 RepID=A0ABZ2TZU1_9ACTN|nr:siderophore-interacting protein [Gordonia hydrophobica]MBM7369401.1 NADPH-dependent ferric siderophore reductase [Gordonia hydrophobica]
MDERRPAYRAVVTAVRDLTPRMRRLTLSAPELAGLLPSGPDEYLGLLMPQRPGHLVALPEHGIHANIRAAVAALPDDRRPDLRWYTVRNHRAESSEIDVDVILHGDTGPGSRFATHAVAGTTLGVVEGAALFAGAARGVTWVIGDETALPAMARIVETAAAGARLHVIVETESTADALPLGDCASQTWVTRGAGLPGAALVDAVRRAPIPSDVNAAWVCGEQGVTATVRRHLVVDRGVRPDRIVFSGYWRWGRARG